MWKWFVSYLTVHIQKCQILLCAGKKRVWIPDEREAYIEVEIKDTDGDKVMVETKDGMVSEACSFLITIIFVLFFSKYSYIVTRCISWEEIRSFLPHCQVVLWDFLNDVYCIDSKVQQN